MLMRGANSYETGFTGPGTRSRVPRSCSKRTRSGVRGVEVPAHAGQGRVGTLCVPLDFAVTLKLLYKKVSKNIIKPAAKGRKRMMKAR